MTSPTGGEDEKLTARQKRKLRKEFSQLGRDSVRYNVQIGGYGEAQRRELALEWLREQEDEDDKINYAALVDHIVGHAGRHEMTAFGLTLNVPRLTLAQLRVATGRCQRRDAEP